MWRKYPYSTSMDTDALYSIVQKSVIHVRKAITSDTPSSNCPLIIRGIEPHQQVDLCTDHCTNLTLIDTVDSQSTTNVNAGPVPVPSVSTSSEYSYYTYK